MKVNKSFLDLPVVGKKKKKVEDWLKQNATEEKHHYFVDDKSWNNFVVEIGLKKSRGLGDTIAKATKAVGITPCGGCNKRREKLNTLFKYE